MINELEILKKFCSLNKFKNIFLLPSIQLATTQQVADFYEAKVDTIKNIIMRNKEELKLDGFAIWKSKDFRILKNNLLNIDNVQGGFTVEFSDGSNIKLSNKGISLFSNRAILKIGMLLRDSTIANELRKFISIENSILYNDLIGGHRLKFKRQEQKFFDYLCFSFEKENIHKQVHCGNYFIDFVLNKNIAIEIDENGHTSYDCKKENERQEYIKNKGYKIIRFNPSKEKPFTLIEKILKIK